MSDRSEREVKDEVQGPEGRKGPDLATEKGRLAFIGILNSRLPKKRLIAQGLLRNERDEVLLCQLVYKKEWDLPGGVVDPGESPAHCVVREVHEELGLDLEVEGMLAVNWLPPYRGWDDALLVLFDLGRADAAIVEQTVLQKREVKAVHWVPPGEVEGKVAPYTAQLIGEAVRATATLYLENSAEPT